MLGEQKRTWYLGAFLAGLVISFAVAKFGYWPILFLFFILTFLFCYLFFEEALGVFAFILPFERTLSVEVKGITGDSRTYG